MTEITLNRSFRHQNCAFLQNRFATEIRNLDLIRYTHLKRCSVQNLVAFQGDLIEIILFSIFIPFRTSLWIFEQILGHFSNRFSISFPSADANCSILTIFAALSRSAICHETERPKSPNISPMRSNKIWEKKWQKTCAFSSQRYSLLLVNHRECLQR